MIIEDPEEDEMERYFLAAMSKEIDSDPCAQPDEYTQALTQLEKIKTTQEDDDDQDNQPNNELEGLEDDMEQMLMDDIHQSMKEEADYQDNTDDKSDFENEYIELIEEFSAAINNSSRKVISLDKITELANRVWSLIDEWRNQDPETIK